MERMSGVMGDLGYGNRERNYQRMPSEPSKGSSNLKDKGLLSLPPLITPVRMPEQIIGTDYDLIKEILVAFRKSGMQWDDYAKKLDYGTREIMAKVFRECRNNGFLDPVVKGENIEFGQIVKRRRQKPHKYELTVKDMED